MSDEPTTFIVQPICAHSGDVMYFGVFALGVMLFSLIVICMCLVNKQFELLVCIFNSVYLDLKYTEISLTFTAGSLCLCGVCNHVVVLCISEWLS